VLLTNEALRHKGVWGSGCIDPCFLGLGTSWRWSASRPGRFISGERAPDTHWRGGWVDPRAGLDDVEQRKFFTLTGVELRPLGHPARSQSLYRLRYPGSYPELLQPHIPLRSSSRLCHLRLGLPSDVFGLNYCMHFLLSYLA
jgi:hypothetical protein